VTEGVIGNIFKQVGDEVAFDDPLFEVSTDKVDSEIPSPYDGVILEVLAQPGETVPVGAPVLRIGGPGATVENRLPSASHAVAAAGGRSLAEASTPSMGGSEGPATEAAGFSTPGDGAVYELTMPKLGESVTEGTISSWLKQVGDEVAFDDPLFEVSTDKVDSEIPSPYDGTLLEILVQADQTVPVGTVLARIGDKSGAPAAGGAPAGGGAQPPSAAPPAATPAAAVLPAGNGEGRLLSPLVRRLGLVESEDHKRAAAEARLRITQAALERLDELDDEAPEHVVQRLRDRYGSRVERLEARMEGDHDEEGQTDVARTGRLLSEMIDAERDVLKTMRTERAFDAEILREIEHELDLDESRLRARIQL